MSDDIDVTPGSGKTVAAEEISAKLYQKIVPVWGPAGTANKTDTASGKAFPVQVRSSTGLIPIGEPTDAAAAQTDSTSVSLISIVKQLSAYLATLGAKTDDKSTATNTTSVSAISIWKQISASIQAAAASLAGALTVSGTVSITDISNGEWEFVAASVSSPQTLGATGAAGDYLSHLVIIPSSTSPGAVTLYDGSNSPDIAITVFAGGSTSLSNLSTFTIAMGMKSVTGSWRITTGSNVSVIGVGNFT